MKTPEEIKKGLECCGADEPCGDCPYNPEVDLCIGMIARDARAYIQQLEDHFREITKMVPRWVSVGDRLPEDDSDYVCWLDDDRNAEICTYCGDGEWLTHDLDNVTMGVAYWMPLPAAPEAENADN